MSCLKLIKRLVCFYLPGAALLALIVFWEDVRPVVRKCWLSVYNFFDSDAFLPYAAVIIIFSALYAIYESIKERLTKNKS